MPTGNENWILDEGDKIIQKMAGSSFDNLTVWELLVYCLWVADYGMTNAGDLDAASDVYAEFQTTALKCAQSLSLRKSVEAFSMTRSNLEKVYAGLFDAICEELQTTQLTSRNDDTGASCK